MYYCYLLKCNKDGSLYCGITNNLKKRLRQHNTGKGSRYVWSRNGGEYVYISKCNTRSEALKKEASIKALKKTDKENLIRAHH